MMKLKGLDVIVIGGGVAGLAAAAFLVRHGAHVQLLEQAGAFQQHGAGIQISPNGARVLHALGLGAQIGDYAIRSEAVVLRAAHDGSQVLHMELPTSDAGFYLFHRADLVDLLQHACGDVQVEFVSRVQSVNPAGPRPQVTLETGRVLDADLVLGADGLRSVTRAAVQSQSVQAPFFTGQVAWRAVIANVATSVPPHAQVFMGPGRHLVTYPLRDGRLRNIIAVEERRQWAAEGWNHPDTPASLRAAFRGFGGPVPEWLEQVETCYLWGLFRHPVADTWCAGHAAILGDAAHPTLPFMAQGANMALEDACALARCLDAAPDIGAGLTRYQQMRIGRTRKIVAAAQSNARNYHLRPPVSHIAHAALRFAGRVRPDAALRRYAWIFDHDITQA